MDIFLGINEKNKERIISYLLGHRYLLKKKESLLKKYKNEHLLVVIETGEINISNLDANGNKTILDTYFDNDIFFIESKNTADEIDVIAKSESHVIVFDYDYLKNNLHNNNEYFNNFMKNLSLILVEQNSLNQHRINLLTKKTIRSKLLAYFNSESTKRGTKYLLLPFSLTELADYLVIDRSAMSRELKYLKDEGFIKQKGKRITLLYR